MTEVEFISATTLNKLILADKKQIEQGYRGLALASCDPEINQVFVITKLNQLFDFYNSPIEYKSERTIH